jgi:osmotically inducible protein OsmC
MLRKANAMWRGTGRDGTGEISTGSGALDQVLLSYKTRFENAKGTNPEELIAAAHAGCFTMAVAFALQLEGFTPTELHTDAVVTLDQDGTSYRISKSALTLRASVPAIDPQKFSEIVAAAEKNCPVSKVLNVAITLNAQLI